MPEAEGAVEIVRRYADAWARGDAATVIGLYADDIVLHYFGDNPIAGEHRGKPAALAVLGRLTQAVKRGAPEIHHVLGGEHHAAVMAKERWGEGADAHRAEPRAVVPRAGWQARRVLDLRRGPAFRR